MQVLNNVFTGGMWGTIIPGVDLPKGIEKVVAENGRATSNTIQNMRSVCFSATFTTQVWGFSTFGGICLQLVTTLAIGAVTHYGQKAPRDSNTHKWCKLIIEGMGITSQWVAPVVNVIALLYFGNVVMGAAVCIMLAVSVLNEQNKLPVTVSNGYSYVIKHPCFLIPMAIATTGLARITVVADIACYLYARYNPASARP